MRAVLTAYDKVCSRENVICRLFVCVGLVFTARCYASAVLAMALCPSVGATKTENGLTI